MYTHSRPSCDQYLHNNGSCQHSLVILIIISGFDVNIMLSIKSLFIINNTIFAIVIIYFNIIQVLLIYFYVILIDQSLYNMFFLIIIIMET